ncbi:MAG: chromate efflux transporter, partial [Solirubrobacteraceae bacterium]|nr:chromate efflux transporter [Solirubrobacteraceae bacterium]
MPVPTTAEAPLAPPPPLRVIAREWTRIGVLGFGGPPVHIVMLRDLVVRRERWIDATRFEDAVAATGLIPGPASTQLAIFCAGALGGWRGALLGAAGFILPGLVAAVALASVLLVAGAPLWLLALGAGAGAAVPAVAIFAGVQLLPDSLKRAGAGAGRVRWGLWVAAGAGGAAVAGPWVVLVLLGCGGVELAWWAWRKRAAPANVGRDRLSSVAPGAAWLVLGATGLLGGSTLAAVAWTAFKVGALSYGGGFVIIPMMQADAVDVYGWLTQAQFLTAVAIGQITPGPVTNTVAAVGWAAAGAPGALIAGLFAFGPSVIGIIVAGRHFELIRRSAGAQAFLKGSGPAAVGAILGSAIPLAMGLSELWQWGLLALALPALLSRRVPLLAVLLAAA